ncbi:hypothetical protein WJX75_009430 [Coccomyxa subellipsoidea]|uniref:Secreted protein n=2 Tax=Trebouxiophyceae TaxID=75966 RepID=A0ABR2YH49_9CHLO|nr:putative extracellular protein CSOL_090 [Pseudococcomyxa simplex]
MNKLLIALVAVAMAAVVLGDVCHYDCYKVDPTKGQQAKQSLLQACGVTDYKFGNATANNLAAVYKQAAPTGCQLAVCGRFATQAAVDSYRNDCEHPKPAYQVLNGTGAGRYDATCTAC